VAGSTECGLQKGRKTKKQCTLVGNRKRRKICCKSVGERNTPKTGRLKMDFAKGETPLSIEEEGGTKAVVKGLRVECRGKKGERKLVRLVAQQTSNAQKEREANLVQGKTTTLGEKKKTTAETANLPKEIGIEVTV